MLLYTILAQINNILIKAKQTLLKKSYMKIQITQTYARITYSNETFTYPLNTLSYAINEELDSITFFRNNEQIGTNPMGMVEVDGEQLTPENVNELLAPLFVKQSGGSEIIQPQLERRIAMVMETDEVIVPVGEPLILYKASVKNVSTLEIKPNDSSVTDWINVPINKEINTDISMMIDTDMLIRIKRTTIDTVSTIYLFTRVKE